MAFNFKDLSIPGVVLIERKIFEDSRGFFDEFYKSSEFKQHKIDKSFIQVNHSFSKKGVLRGLHYQLMPYEQAKLVCVISGQIYDVVVDVRKGSPSYGKWLAEVLSSQNRKMLYIPAGFAHGFCVMSDSADVIYYCTKEYSTKDERGILWNDPKLDIKWPAGEPIISEKDAQLPILKNAENNFEY